MNIDNPTPADVDKAIHRVGEALSCVALAAQFIQSEHFDMNKWGFHLGETLAMVEAYLSDAHLTLLNASPAVDEVTTP